MREREQEKKNKRNTSNEGERTSQWGVGMHCTSAWVFTLYTQLAALVPSKTSKWRNVETKSISNLEVKNLGKMLGVRILEFPNLWIFSFLSSLLLNYYSIHLGYLFVYPLLFTFSFLFPIWRVKIKRYKKTEWDFVTVTWMSAKRSIHQIHTACK